MPVQFACEHCGKTIRVRDDLAGKRVKCPKCQGVVRVPAAAAEKWRLQTEDGETYGPVDRNELDRWSQEGRVTAECRVLREGTDQWQWATELYPHLAPETAPVAPAERPAATPRPPQVPESPQAAVPAAASQTTSPSKSGTATSAAASRSGTVAPRPAAPPAGAEAFDFAPPGKSAPAANPAGPFDFAPGETATTNPGGSLHFGAGAGRARAAAKKGKKTTRPKAAPPGTNEAGEARPKSKVVALLLAFFLGTLGVHRFYLGHTTIGVLMLVTMGGCGIWALVDFILIAIGKVDRDAQGRLLS